MGKSCLSCQKSWRKGEPPFYMFNYSQKSFCRTDEDLPYWNYNRLKPWGTEGRCKTVIPETEFLSDRLREEFYLSMAHQQSNWAGRKSHLLGIGPWSSRDLCENQRSLDLAEFLGDEVWFKFLGFCWPWKRSEVFAAQ